MKKNEIFYRFCNILLNRLSWEDHSKYRPAGYANPWPPVVRMEVLWADLETEVEKQTLAEGYTYEKTAFPARLYRLLKKQAPDIRIISATSKERTEVISFTTYDVAVQTEELIRDGHEIRVWYNDNGKGFFAGVRKEAAKVWR